MPERTLLGVLARTAHWLEWHRRFSPASGSDPKLADPFFRYVITTFCYGTNLGPAQAARHIAGVSAHELSATARRHVTVDKLNKAIADVVNALELDLIRVWANGVGRGPIRPVPSRSRSCAVPGTDAADSSRRT